MATMIPQVRFWFHLDSVQTIRSTRPKFAQTIAAYFFPRTSQVKGRPANYTGLLQLTGVTAHLCSFYTYDATQDDMLYSFLRL